MSNIVAITLIGLILCPFTAPFVTYELSHGHTDVLYKSKDNDEHIVVHLAPPEASRWLPIPQSGLVAVVLPPVLFGLLSHTIVLRL